MGMRTYNQFNKLIIVYDYNPSGKNVMGWVSLDEEDAQKQIDTYVYSFVVDSEFRREQLKLATDVWSESYNPIE